VELPIDYHREDVAPKIMEWTHGKGVNVVLDTVGGETFCQSFAATAVYGKIVTLLQTECPADKHKLARLRNLSLIYELMLAPLYLGLHEARLHQRHILEEGAKLAARGELTAIVSRVMDLSEAALAHQQIEAGHTTGKIVLEIP
jgi:NADPH2:quinone reductase